MMHGNATNASRGLTEYDAKMVRAAMARVNGPLTYAVADRACDSILTRDVKRT